MIAKEIRVLLPAWAAAVAAMVACSLIRDLYAFGIPAYFIGAATLGAMSMGHEFSHRTVSLMLTLPVSRRRILLTKLVVLGAGLLLLALIAARVLPYWREATVFRATTLWLPFFAGLFITPYLTTITRSPVGGAVFTMGIAGLLTIAGDWLGVETYGYTREVDAFRIAFVWQAELLLCVASAILMARTFKRLQVLDGPGPAVDFAPSPATASTSLTRRSVTWLLLEKELRLQQMAFAIAAIYAVLYVITVVRTRAYFSTNDAAFIESLLYAGILAVVIGAVASAEERDLRTLDSQLLLPVRTSTQWMVKLSVVLGLTFLLGIVLPTVLASVFPPERIVWARNLQSFRAVSTILGLMAIATLSLYVSTLCSSGLWALLVSFPAAFGVAALVLWSGAIVEAVLHSLDGRPDWSTVRWATAIMTVSVIVVVTRLAFTNHRSADRSPTRTLGQVAIAAGSVIAATGVVAIVGALSSSR